MKVMVAELFAIIIIVLSLAFAVTLTVRNFRRKEFTGPLARTVPVVLYSLALMVSCDMSIGDVLYPRLMFDMSVAGTAMFIMTSSVWTSDSGRIIAIIVSGIMAAVSLFYILCLTGLLTVPGTVFFIWSSSIMTIASAVLFIVGLWLRIRNVREVMRAGSVWVSLSLAVDSIYIMTMFTFIMVYGLFVLSGCDDNSFIGCLVAVLYVGILTAFGSRIVSDSLFVFMQRHERRIVESMKVTQVEVATDSSRIEMQYKELFERVQAYFTETKAYLKGDLTIGDVVQSVYTNKLYISRAISQSTGRNFCQYVNYFRVTHSVESFRANPKLKIHELANMSGFNTVVSFNMAFRLYMGENPSDWCRKEKKRLTAGKKLLVESDT